MEKGTTISRKGFFRGIAKGVAAAGVIGAVTPIVTTGLAAAEPETGSKLPNDVLRMLGDVRRALKKPVNERKWGMVIDVKKCIGCEACSIACIAENNLPPGVTYRRVLEVEDGTYPDVKRIFMPTNCMQCDSPSCVDAAEKIAPGAMFKRPDGIVEIRYDKFKGQKVIEAATKACPFKAIYSDRGGNHTDGTPAVQAYEKRTTVEYGKQVTREQLRNTGRKCHFCLHRIEAGMLPACVSSCTGQAMHFGDMNDDESLVSELRKKQRNFRLEGAKRQPNIIYTEGREDPKISCTTCHEGH